MKSESKSLDSWAVRFDTEEVQFKDFTAAVTYADSLAQRRTLIKHIDPQQKLIELSADRKTNHYEFDYYMNRRSDP